MKRLNMKQHDEKIERTLSRLGGAKIQLEHPRGEKATSIIRLHESADMRILEHIVKNKQDEIIHHHSLEFKIAQNGIEKISLKELIDKIDSFLESKIDKDELVKWALEAIIYVNDEDMISLLIHIYAFHDEWGPTREHFIEYPPLEYMKFKNPNEWE